MIKIILRITIVALLIAAPLWFYAWIPIVLSLPFLFIYDKFYEILIVGLAIDLIYGEREMIFLKIPLLYASIAAILFIGSHYLKKRLRF